MQVLSLCRQRLVARWSGCLFRDAVCRTDSRAGTVEISRNHGLVRLARRLLGLKRGATVVVPSNDFLIKQVKVPGRARGALKSIARLTIERATPFQPEDVYWSVHNVRPDGGGGFRADVVLIARRRVGNALAALEAEGLTPLMLQSEEGSLATRLDERGVSLRRPAIAVGLLAVAAAGVPLVEQEREMRRLEREVAALDPISEAPPAPPGDGREVVWTRHLAQRSRLGMPIAVLFELTEHLPDDTYVEYYRQHDGLVEIRGRTPRAATLAQGLARSQMFDNVRLGAPTSAGEDRSQAFVLIADLAGTSR